MSNVIHIGAWRAATFRGSREQPDWCADDIAACERYQARPDIRQRIEEIGRKARKEREVRNYELTMKAAQILSEGRGPHGGGAV